MFLPSASNTMKLATNSGRSAFRRRNSSSLAIVSAGSVDTAAAESGQEVPQVADMILDLGGNQPRLVGRALDGRLTVVLPLAP